MIFRMKFKRAFTLFLFIFLFFSLSIQAQNRKVIQFSGVIYSADTAHRSIPFATVYDYSLGNIAISNFTGFFSLVGYEGDTSYFSTIGFKTQQIIIPIGNETEKFTANFYLAPTFYMLPEAIVYPWGSRDQFPYAFIHTPIPDDDLERARKNLNPDYLRSLSLAQNADPNINARMVMNNYSQTLYYYGQAHPISLLNAFAWSQFISDLKSGKYKNPNKK